MSKPSEVTGLDLRPLRMRTRSSDVTGLVLIRMRRDDSWARYRRSYTGVTIRTRSESPIGTDPCVASRRTGSSDVLFRNRPSASLGLTRLGTVSRGSSAGVVDSGWFLISDPLLLEWLFQVSLWGKRAFPVIVPRLWNSLPPDTRNSLSVSTFRLKLKTHLFKLAFPLEFSPILSSDCLPGFDSCFSFTFSPIQWYLV